MEVISKLLSFVPDDLLEKLATSTGVNKFSKKLQGELLFKLLLYCIVTEKDNSLRGMQSALESAVFSVFKSKKDAGKISHSSISERLTSIKPVFFEEIFYSCVYSYRKSLGKIEEDVIRFDSTIVSLSGKFFRKRAGAGAALRGHPRESAEIF